MRRPEQLNLAEDPYFFPDIDIGFDLTAFGFPSNSSSSMSAMSPRTLPSSQSSLPVVEEEEDEPGLEIPSLDTPGDIGGFEPNLGAGTSSVVRTGSAAGAARGTASIFDDEPAIIEEPIFDVGDDGELFLIEDDVHRTDLAIGEGEQSHPASETGVRAGTEHSTAAVGHEPMSNFEDDVPMFGDDDHEPTLPSMAPATPQPTDGNFQQEIHVSPSVHPSDETLETAEAPQHRKRPAKAIRPDQRTELSNKDLNDWNAGYLFNMAAAARAKQAKVSGLEARRNAEFWVFSQGIGNVASTFGGDRTPHPFVVFVGQNLWDLLKGPESGMKRSRSSSSGEEDEGEEARRVRARTTSQEDVARGGEDDILLFNDDDGGMLQEGDDFNIESEVGRHAPPSLPDHSSGMPWNTSASRHSSARPLMSGGLARLSSSVGGLQGGMDFGPPSALRRRGSRFTSASPLLGKGPLLSRLGSQEHLPLEPSRLTSNEDEFADLDAQLGAGVDVDFELYGPSAIVDTQTAGQSQWVAATLENEAYNFLTFVTTKIQSRAEEQAQVEEAYGEGLTQDKITFEELLPPTRNSQIVGAQALLHVLALATKGLLEVYQGQAEPFGEIQLAVVSQ